VAKKKKNLSRIVGKAGSVHVCIVLESTPIILASIISPSSLEVEVL